jgi:hypothetical protein
VNHWRVLSEESSKKNVLRLTVLHIWILDTFDSVGINAVISYLKLFVFLLRVSSSHELYFASFVVSISILNQQKKTSHLLFVLKISLSN